MSSTRRDFLKLLASGVVGLAVGAGAGYFAGAQSMRPTSTPVSQPPQGARKLRALWIYVGPIADYGWTRAHHDGKEYVSGKYGWLEAEHVEKVAEDQAYNVIKNYLESEHYDAVFATSYGFMDAIKRLASEYPETMFYHCSGPWEEFKDLPNVSTYFAEFYQLYYLNGLAAGAVTETCKVGYVPAFLIPEVVRHIDAFALGVVDGARLMGKCGGGEGVEIYVTTPLKSWFAPQDAANYAKALVDQYDVDVIAFTEDSTAVLETAEKYWGEGRKVYSFSHYSDMYGYFKKKGQELRSHLTGQIANWGPIYEYLLVKLYAGAYIKEDVWARLGDFVPIRWRRDIGESLAGSPEGAVYLANLNTQAIPAKALDMIKRRYEEMKEGLFDPFTGPIKGYEIDSEGRPQEEAKLKVEEGVRLGRAELWAINWFHEKIISLAK